MLPVEEFIPQIKNCLASNNNLVLQAEPGAGKSTVLPLRLLESNWLKGRKIIMLEPRRVAVKTIAYYLAKQLGEPVGRRIGYQIKNDRKVSNETVLEIVTEGILTRRLQNDPELPDIALIIFDEFHERSIQADLSLMFALEIQSTIRDDLKLLVMSATINTTMMSKYMRNANIIECPGRVFPVSVSYINPDKTPISKQIVKVLRHVLAPENDGNTLVFLAGQADIKKCIAESLIAFSSRTDLIFLPLFGALPIQQQEKALVADANGKRRIIFATNIAETSLTIEGVTCVIDTGQEKVLVYDPSSCMTRLETAHISKASAQQRKGRAGRTQAGCCFRLWDKLKQQKLKNFQEEEILSADLTGLVLELFLWGETNFDEINWLTPPPIFNFESARSTLVSLGLINSLNQLTYLGKKASNSGLSPRLAAMLFRAKDDIEKGIACELAALLSERDIFSQNSGVDIVDRMLAIQDYKKNQGLALKTYPVTRSSLEQLLNTSRSLRRSLGIERALPVFNLAQCQGSTGKLLLYAYPDRLARRRSSNSTRYLLANGKGVFLPDGDPLSGSEWLVAANCDAQMKEGRVFAAASINYEDLLVDTGNLLSHQDEFYFDQKKQKVCGRSVSRYGAIQLESAVITVIPADKFQQCLLQVFEQEGMAILNWTSKCESWLSRVNWLGSYLENFPQLSKESLLKDINNWLLPYVGHVKTIADLKKVDIYSLMISILSWQEQQLLDREAPVYYITPGNKSIPVNYDSKQGPIVSVVLQEMFGETTSPTLGGGRVPLRFELLSPAHRPIQTTSDLANFWNTSYFDVVREMKGRYPRHRWPDQPLLEKPGRSIKR